MSAALDPDERTNLYRCTFGRADCTSALARSLQLDTIPAATIERTSSVLDLLEASAHCQTDAAGPATDSDPTHGVPRPSGGLS